MDTLSPLLADRLLMLSAGLILAMCWPDRLRPKVLPLKLERFLLSLAHKLNRSKRSVATRVYRGLLLLVFLAGGASAVGYGLSFAAQHMAWLELVEIALIGYLIPVRALRDKAAAVGQAVKHKQFAKAQGLLGGLARREAPVSDAHGLLRISLEYATENFSDQIVAPACYYLLLGPAGLCVLRMVNMLDRLIGHRSAQWMAFGWAAAKSDDLLMLIPARLSALWLMAASVFVPKGRPIGALKTALREAHKTVSPNAGWPLAAMAGALSICLGGARRNHNAQIDDAWIGPGSARLSYADFRRGLVLYAVASLLLFLSCVISLARLSDISLIAHLPLGLAS